MRIKVVFAAALLLVAASAADARITKIRIVTKESPAFGGYAFKDVGQYEKLVGKAYGELDPNDPKNSVIVDIKLAPRNARGKVEYAFDFYILKPIDLAKGSHKAMYEPPNRGRKTHESLNRGAGGNDPGAEKDPVKLANTFLLPRGYTMVWSGWDASAGTDDGNYNTTITLPVAKNPDGSAITGPSYDYIVSGDARSVESEVDAPRASRRRAAGRAGERLGVRRGGDVDSSAAAGDAVHAGRHLRALVHRKGSHGERCRLCRGARLQRVSPLRA